MNINIYCGLHIEQLNFNTCSEDSTPQFLNHIFEFPADQQLLVFPEDRVHPNTLIANLYEVAQKSSRDGVDVNIITHSENVVNFLALMLHKEHQNPVSVLGNVVMAVHIFSDDNGSISTTSTVNDKGFLENWQYGFFDFQLDNLYKK